MDLRSTLMTLGRSALAQARTTGATLLRSVRPGDRVQAPPHAPDIMAPWPNTDRYPTIIGSQLTFGYISACQRQAQFGYRLQWVDLLRELIRRDPSAYGNLTARILATSGGRVQVLSAAAQFSADELGDAERERVRRIRQAAGLAPELPTLTDDERILADQIACHVQRQIDALPQRPQILAQQLWAIYYGVSADELLWDRTPSEWRLRELYYLAPRRIAYPDQNSFHPHVWDQGLVVTSGPEWRDYLSGGLFGLDIADYPNKFLVHVGHVLGGYPTEDGLGFILAWWIAAKMMGARSYMQFVERYAKPGVIAKYNTKNADKVPRNAPEEDMAIGQQVVQAMGYGGAPGAVIPDSLELELFGPAAMKGSSGTADPRTFVDWCDDQIAKAIRTTSALQGLQKNGARSALETLEKGANRVAFYDAMGLSATWTRDVGAAIARLNYPTLERLMPTVVIHVDDEPGPEVMLDRIERAVAVGMPIDADKAAQATGMSNLLAVKGDPNARVLYVAKGIEALPPQKPSDAGEDESENEGGGEEQTEAPTSGAAGITQDEEENDES
jgi:hypothetical protein